MELTKPWMVVWIIKPNIIKTKEFDDPFTARDWAKENVRNGRMYHYIDWV